mmetsp:Transcript_129994/g.337106  ORF Transcript_129994/g.337106 Transcript_129994/m.337106 type:complete len:80 (+) Transcript_129994:62-301(+)
MEGAPVTPCSVMPRLGNESTTNSVPVAWFTNPQHYVTGPAFAAHVQHVQQEYLNTVSQLNALMGAIAQQQQQQQQQQEQ